MMIASVLLLSSAWGAGETPVIERAMPMRVAGPWSVEVGPGTVSLGGRTIDLKAPVTVEVQPPERLKVRDECYVGLPVFNPNAGGWLKGTLLKGMVTEECSATGTLYPDSVRVKSAPGDGPLFILGKDYDLDPFWGALGRIEGGTIAAKQSVLVDYDHELHRLDSIVADAAGTVHLVQGVPEPAVALPPKVQPGDTLLANVWVPGRTEKLAAENLFLIDPQETVQERHASPTAETLLPKTLAKLRAGDTVTIIAFGDSVTAGGGVGNRMDLWYQNQFAALLRARFPKTRIRMLTAAWPGAGSKMYLEAPAGGPYDFARDVLDPKPDLVTIEFVNDAYLDEAGTAAHYSGIVDRLRAAGAEVALITPHLVRPDWLKTDTLKFDQDPRPYVRGLHQFATEHHVALADASAMWCRLWRQGLPYVTLLANSINHPDARGHAIFAEALVALFPER